MSSANDLDGLSNHHTLSHHATRSTIPGISRNPTDPSHKNISRLRDRSVRFHPHELNYKPKVSEGFLEEWLDFPVEKINFIPFSMMKMFGTWLLWNSKSMAGLDPNDTSIRDRVTNQVSVLGTAAGLFLVVAIAGFLVPPITTQKEDKAWVDVFGGIMFTASVSLIFYLCLALTAFYPLIESMRDDVVFDAFETYQRRVGGYETYLFYFGMNLVGLAILVATKIIYSTHAAIIMLIIFVIFVCITAYLSKEIFISLDPISSMHLGLTNDPEVQYRAELLSHFMLRKIPNSIVNDESVRHEKFAEKRESTKYEETRASMKHMTTLSTLSAARSYDSEPESNNLLVHTDERDDVNDFDRDEVKVQNIESGALRADAAIQKSQHRASHFDPAALALRETFCGDAYVFQSYGLSKRDSVAAYDCVVRCGCASMDELLHYLNDNKQARLQGVCNCTEPDRAHGAHDVDCSSRVAAMWASGLTNIGIPTFHAMKIIRAIKNKLR